MKHHTLPSGKILAAIAVIIILLAGSSTVQAGFEDLDAGARSMGMGGAFIGLSDDASALLYNPAGIATIQRLDLLVNYSSLFGGLTAGSIYNGYVGLVLPTESIGSFGVGFYQRGAGLSSKTFYSESVVALGYANRVDKFSFGFTAKILMLSWNEDFFDPTVQNYLTDSKKSSLDIDAGVMYQPFENLSLGLAVENVIASDMTIHTDSEHKLDRVVKPGVAFKIGEPLSPYTQRRPATIVADISYKIRDQRDPVSRIHLGAEGWLFRDGIFALRGGYTTGDEEYQRLTFGTSVRFTPIHPGLQLDYGYQVQSGNIEEVNTHRFALRFNNVPVIRKLDPDKIGLSLVADPGMFSPNMDGRMDVTALRPITPKGLDSESWKVQLFIKNTGAPVRAFMGQGEAPEELSWRGKDDNGMPLPDDRYIGVYEAATLYEGVFKSANTEITLDTTPPEVFIQADPQTFMPLNEDGSLPNATTFRLSANDALSGTEAWSLYIRKKESNENFRTITGRGAPQDNVIWDGTDDNGMINHEGGSYIYVLEAVDLVGNRAWTEPNYVYTSTSVRAGPDEGTLQMVHEKIFFDLDKATIRPESYSILDRVVRELEKFTEYSLVISAHTCNLGSDEYNQELSQRRAVSVMEYLKAKDAIQRVADVKGYGESRPIESNDTEAGREKNRRVELVLVPR